MSDNQVAQLPAVTISFNLPAGTSLGVATSQIALIRQQLRLPTAISTSFSGTAQVFEDAAANQNLLPALRRGPDDLPHARHTL